MGFREYRYLVRSDLYRYRGKNGMAEFLVSFLFNPGFKYTFWMRSCAHCRSKWYLRFSLLPCALLVLRHYGYKYGISIADQVAIGSGFYIGHFGSIVINSRSVVGKNCNIMHDVTLGKANRGRHQGYPTIGDNVYLAPGSRIVGNVVVGNNVAVGANCVVTDNVPDGAVVVGVPGRIVSYEGSRGYLNNTDY